MNFKNLISKVFGNTKRISGEITLNEAEQIIRKNSNVILLDVRSMQEYKEYHINGAICIPNYEIQSRVEKEIPNKESVVIIYCQSGIRSKKVVTIMRKLGYRNIFHISNGLNG